LSTARRMTDNPRSCNAHWRLSARPSGRRCYWLLLPFVLLPLWL
jgi:hypothetical protein